MRERRKNMARLADHMRTTELTSEESAWLDRMKQTMALELARGMAAGVPPKGLVGLLLGIPEVREALEMRAKGRP